MTQSTFPRSSWWNLLGAWKKTVQWANAVNSSRGLRMEALKARELLAAAGTTSVCVIVNSHEKGCVMKLSSDWICSLSVGMAVLLFNLPGAFAQEDKTSATASEHQLIRSQLGYGYNINGKYCNRDSFTEAIFEIPKDGSEQESAYDFTRDPAFEGGTTSGSDSRQFTQSLAAKAGASYEGAAFSGELNAEFNFNENSTSESSFILDQRALTLFRVTMTTRTIKPEVRADIDQMPAEQFIRKYGTHYARDLYYGGNVTFRSSATNTSSDKAESFDVSAVASGWGAKGSASVKSDLNETEKKLRSNVTLKSYGGQPGVVTQTNFDDSTFDAWKETVPANIGLAAFGSRSLVPIWELASTPTRMNELKAAATRLNPVLKTAGARKAELRAQLRSYKAYGEIIYLQESGGDYVTDAHNGTDWYFPVLGNKPQKVEIRRTDYGKTDNVLRNGDTVWFWYQGSDVADWNARWKEDRWLYVGENQDAAHWCENGSGAQYEWNIFIKGVDPATKEIIRAGDEVAIESRGYGGRYLVREQGKFLDANTPKTDAQGNKVIPYFKLVHP